MTTVLPEWPVINSVSFGTPNCKAVDVLPFMKWLARHSTTLIPGMDGQLDNPEHLDAFTETLEVRLRGDVDEDGVVIADPYAGLKALISSLRSSVVGQQTAVLHFGATTVSASVTVTRFEPIRTGPLTATLLLQVTVPDGEFT